MISAPSGGAQLLKLRVGSWGVYECGRLRVGEWEMFCVKPGRWLLEPRAWLDR